MSFGSKAGLPLIHKLVKPIKVTSSRTTDELRFNKLLVSKRMGGFLGPIHNNKKGKATGTHRFQLAIANLFRPE